MITVAYARPRYVFAERKGLSAAQLGIQEPEWQVPPFGRVLISAGLLQAPRGISRRTASSSNPHSL
jgi:hypothetical protein